MLETSHPKVRAAYHRPYSTESVLQSISDLSETLEQGDAVVRQMLKRIVPEYSYPMPASINQKNDQTADNDAGFEEATRLNEHKNGNLPVENGRIPFPK
jgi:hypothetical protein